MAEMLTKNRRNFRLFFCQLANLNASLYGDETRQERCLCSRLEVHEVARRSLQPLLNGEENAEATEATVGRCLGELPRGIAVEREHAFS